MNITNRALTKQLLLSNNYWVLNKTLVQALGLETAFLVSHFAEAETMMGDEEGWFYQTSDTVENMTTLTRHKQDICIKQLEDMGILEKDVRGMPAKRYFRLNYKSLTNLFVENLQTGMRKTDKLVCKKSATNKEHTNKELNYKESINSVEDKSSNETLEEDLKYKDDSKEIKLARHMREELLRIKSDSRVPSNTAKGLQGWARDIDYIIRLDKRDPQMVADLFTWAQEDSFWTANVRSPGKLRKQWDTLEIQMGRDSNETRTRQPNKKNGQDEEIDWAARAGVQSF